MDQLAKIREVKLFWPRFQGRTAKVKIADEEVILLKPYTYMNLSGVSVAQALKKFRLTPENLIVVHDDLDLSLGQIKIGFALSSAGHKGVESIIEHLGHKNFYRVRLGIGKPKEEEDLVEYVLSDFAPSELAQVERMIEEACKAIEVLLSQGLEKAQNLFHRRN